MNFTFKYLINVGMLISFFICGISGVLKLPELMIPFGNTLYYVLSLLHDWSGILGVVLAVIHTVVHLKWFRRGTKQLFSASCRKSRASVGAGLPKRYRKAVQILMILSFLFISGASLWARDTSRASSPTIPEGIDYPAGTFIDGIYTGTAVGYMPGLTVEVTVSNGQITSVDVVDHNETDRWFNRVLAILPGNIIDAQSSDIDSISGATCSSYGILSAVENALQGAVM